MRLTEIISQETVLFCSHISSKKRLFQEISNSISNLCNLDQNIILSALLDREQLGPTGIGRGIAIPHARLTNIKKIKGIFIRLDKPISYESIDGKPIDLVFALLAPAQSGVDHLKSLAKVSRLLRVDNICKKLRSTEDTVALFSILTDDIDSAAA